MFLLYTCIVPELSFAYTLSVLSLSLSQLNVQNSPNLKMLKNSNSIPQWLKSLFTEKFFNACIIHEDAKKNEKNIFCLDCCDVICPNCLPQHYSHCLLQIRRYMLQDVLRLGDAHKLMDCSYVQTYITNGAKVVFIHQRNQTKSSRGACKRCIFCLKAVQENMLFCSIYCKMQHILRSGEKLSKYVYHCESMALVKPVAKEGRMTPDTVLEPAGSVKTESGSSSSGAEGFWTLALTATTEILKRKRSRISVVRPVCGPVINMSNRRKGTPHRSPLY